MDVLRGSVETIRFNNPTNGYSVLVVRADAANSSPKVSGNVTVVGVMPEVTTGMDFEFSGQWIDDAKWGRQFKAERSIPAPPSSRDGLVAYLGGGLVKGIGPRTAEKIVAYLGKSALTILDSQPERLFDMPGLKRDQAQKLITAWKDGQHSRRALIELQDMGISGAMSSRIIKELGAEAAKLVRQNPYTLADEVYGYGFVRADAVAQRQGVQPDDPNRIRAGLRYVLNQAAFDGHVYLPRSVLIERSIEALRVPAPDLIEAIISEEAFLDRLMIEGDAATPDAAIYTPDYYEAETDAADRLHALAVAPSPIAMPARDAIADGLFDELAKQKLVLSEQQAAAVTDAITHKVTVLTGGPGTGKTTTLRAVIHALEALEKSFMLASPTGRAAKRLGEATGRPALTIHRLLGFFPDTGEFLYDESNPLEIDMLILDETSMLDLMLLDAVLRALKPEAHLMLVGDVDQLPSVGAGNVLRDVIESGAAHVTRLMTIFRQAEGSRIIANAHRINSGQEPLLDNPPGMTDFFFFTAEDPDRAGDLLVDIVVNRLPSRFGVDPVRDVQVIAPMYKGAAGVDALNAKLQEALNPARYGMNEYKAGMKALRIGDKVMQTKNNYELDVFNGDIGYISDIDREANGIGVEMDTGEVFYDLKEADQLIHAYCISTHRSQGSEYPVVVMPVLTQHYVMLQRNLLYTAVTRAKQMVVLVGTRKAVALAVENARVTERYTGLRARLEARMRGYTPPSMDAPAKKSTAKSAAPPKKKADDDLPF